MASIGGEIFPRIAALGGFEEQLRQDADYSFSRDEFEAHYAYLKECDRRLIFDAFDIDGDGTVGLGEVKRSINLSDKRFASDHASSALSFGFTATERTSFVDRFLEQKAVRLEEEDGEDGIDWTISDEDFARNWRATRGFAPSADTMKRVKSVFNNGNINMLSFASKCTLNPLKNSHVPFPVAYFRMQIARHRAFLGLAYYIPFLILFSYFLASGKGIDEGGYFLHRQGNELFGKKMFKMPCTGNACYTDSVQEKDYADVGQASEFYPWLYDVVLPGLWSGGDDNSTATSPMQFHTFPVGALRIEQVRVDGKHNRKQYDFYFRDAPADDPVVQNAYPRVSQGDYALNYPGSIVGSTAYSKLDFTPETTASGTALDPLAAGAFQYSGCNTQVLFHPTPYIYGEIGTYPCGGFRLDIPYNNTKANASALIAELEANNWIDLRTRGLWVHIVTFNKDLQLFSLQTFGFEIAAGGIWKPLTRSSVVPYFDLPSRGAAWIFFLVVFWIWLVALILYWGFSLAQRVAYGAKMLGLGVTSTVSSEAHVLISKWSKFRVILRALGVVVTTEPSYLVDGFCYIVFLLAWIFRIVVWTSTLGDPVYGVSSFPQEFSDYAVAAQITEYLDIVAVYFVYLKLFSYFKLFKVLSSITETIKRSSYDLYGIAFTFFVFLVAFMLCGHIAYGGILEEFATPEKTLATLLRFIIGDFNYAGWAVARQVVTPIYFTLLQVFMVLVLLNCIIAVLADNFAEVEERSAFDADTIKLTVESDPTCSLTFDRDWTLKNLPVVTDLRQLFNKTATCCKWLCGKCRKTKSDEDAGETTRELTEELIGELEELRGYPHQMNLYMSEAIEEVYFGDRETSVLALFRLYHAVQYFSSQESLEFNMSLLHNESIAELRGSRSLIEILRSGFKNFTNLYVCLMLHLPQAVAEVSLSDSVLSLLASHEEWQYMVERDVNVERDYEEELEDLGGTLKEALDFASKLDFHRGRGTHKGPMASRNNRTPPATSFQFPVEKRDEARSIVRNEMQHEDHEVTDNVRSFALFAGMPLESVQRLQHSDYNSLSEEEKLKVRQHYKAEWRERQAQWRKVDTIDDELVSAVFGREDMTLAAGLNDDSPGSPTALAGISARWPSMSSAPVLETMTRQSYRCGWTADERKRFQRAFRLRHPDEPATLELEQFALVWKSALGTSLGVAKMSDLTLLSTMKFGGDVMLIDMKEFLLHCTSSNETHSAISYENNFYTVQHGKMWNILQLAIYVPFLVCLMYLTLTTEGRGDSAWVTMSLADNTIEDPFPIPEFISYNSIRTEDHFYSWLETNFVGNMFQETESGIGPASPDDMNLGVGALRIRQLRATNEPSCSYDYTKTYVEDSFYRQRVEAFFTDECIPRWGEASRDQRQFPNKSEVTSSVVLNGFTYSACSTSFNIPLIAEANNEMYSCGGYNIDIPYNSNQATVLGYLTEMKSSDWINQQTRALIVESFFYNYNINVFTRMRWLIEVTGGGGWLPTYRIDSFRVFAVDTTDPDYFAVLVIFLIFFIINVFVYIRALYKSICHLRRNMATTYLRAILKYATEDQWWLLDFLNYTMILLGYIFRFVGMGVGDNSVKVYDADNFPKSLELISNLSYIVLLFDCFTAFLSFVKIFYFVRLHSRLNLLSMTLKHSARSVLSVLVLSAIMITGFAAAGHIVYGHTVQSMSNMPNAYETLALTVFGESEFENWFADQPIFTAFYFTFYVILVVTLMFNMLTSVITNAYQAAKSEQFDETSYWGSLYLDPSVPSSGLLTTIFASPVVTELAYWPRRLFYTIRCDDEALLKLELQNHRTFYRYFSELFSTIDQARGYQTAVASADLLSALATIDKYYERDVLQYEMRHALRRDRETNCVYGFKILSVEEHAKDLLPKGLYRHIRYYCVTIPFRALTHSRAQLYMDVMSVNARWEAVAKDYCKVGDVDDEGDPVVAFDRVVGDAVSALNECCNTE